jgi:RecA-family ATPase
MGSAKTIRIVNLPDLPDKGDVSDWLDADPRRAEKLGDICFDVAEWVPVAAAIVNTPDESGDSNERDQDECSNDTETAAELGEWDAGDDIEPPPPRAWLLGNVFARRFISSLFAEGGTGKTAVRYAQYLSLATANPLTGEHVFQRCRVLVVSLEDDADELRRRIRAARFHHGIDLSEVRGWLFLAAPGKKVGKLTTVDKKDHPVRGTLAGVLEATIVKRKIDLVSLDPFVKAHAVDENMNKQVDEVVEVLTELAIKYDIAVDIPHHTSKGPADPGNASRGRGASSMKDAGRLIYTLTTMSAEEAQAFAIEEDQRRFFVRMDSAKINIAPPMTKAKWFRIVGVPLDNATELYPNGATRCRLSSLGRPPIFGKTSV